jgi:hypothetical protein
MIVFCLVFGHQDEGNVKVRTITKVSLPENNFGTHRGEHLPKPEQSSIYVLRAGFANRLRLYPFKQLVIFSMCANPIPVEVIGL